MDHQELQDLLNKIEEDPSLATKYKHYRRIDNEKAWLSFRDRVKAPLRKTAYPKLFLRYAAAILLPLTILSLMFWFRMNTPESKVSLAHILPGSSQATLVLYDGQEIALDSTDTALLSFNQSMQTILSAKQLLAEKASPNPEIQYNSLITKRGGEYRFVLEDGTKVYLNADSKLRYPTSFSQKERTVYLEGEAFFEVAPDTKRPFFVVADGLKVKQYGTAFNINAYKGKNIEVVLVRGSIGIVAGDSEKILSPGQLAEYSEENQTVQTRQVDIDSHIAWHEGRFSFDNRSLKEIMHILSRWYNVNIRFLHTDIQEMRFTGSLDRYDSMEPIMQAITKVAGIKVEERDQVLYISE